MTRKKSFNQDYLHDKWHCLSLSEIRQIRKVFFSSYLQLFLFFSLSLYLSHFISSNEVRIKVRGRERSEGSENKEELKRVKLNMLVTL